MLFRFLSLLLHCREQFSKIMNFKNIIVTRYLISPIHLLSLFCLFFCANSLNAQIIQKKDTLAAIADSKIILSGNIFDTEDMNPVAGAIVEVQTVYPRRSARTNFDGSFQIKGLPLGTHKIIIEAPGYEFKEVHSITLSAEAPTINLVIKIKKGRILPINKENPTPIVVEKRPKRKVPTNISIAALDMPVNEMSIVSLRSFSFEEMQHFAGSRQDPARVLSNYMGIRNQDDYNNNIIVRGNSPNGFQWNLEGVPMPNPGYLGDFNMNGGLANIFSPRILNQSDVQLAAFSANHGNAVAGIFDAQLRHKYLEKLTFSGQVNSTTGAELMVEGFSNKSKKSGYFFVNYRLSRSNYLTYLIAHAINPKHSAAQTIPNFQDLSFKVVLPTENSGEFTFFGLSGIAGNRIDAIRTSALAVNDQFIQQNQVSQNNSIIGVGGFKHKINIKETRRSYSYIQTTLASTFLKTKQNLLLQDGRDTSYFKDLNDRKNSIFFSTVYHHKFDQYLSFQGGVKNEIMLFNLDGQELSTTQPLAIDFGSINKGATNLLNAYTMALWKPMINFKLNMGLHVQWLSLTNSYSVEPRLAFRWEFTPQQFFSFGYGLHSQMQPLQAYFSRRTDGTDVDYVGELNKLDFSRSHHFVIGYDYWIDNNWRLHAELYHEEMFNVPVDSVDKVFSMMNYNGGSLGDISQLVNKGTGYTQGLEISIERYFNKGFYALASMSVYHTAYTDYQGIVRDISFNNNFNLSILAGKAIMFGAERNNSINIDARIAYGGPRYSEVVNYASSVATGVNVYQSSYGSSMPTDPYFRADIKLGVTFRNELKAIAQTAFIEVINLTAAKNTNGQYFDRNTQTVQFYQQLPMFFEFGYQFQF